MVIKGYVALDLVEKHLLLDIIMYLKSRGGTLASLAGTAGQNKLKIEIRGLFWYHIRTREFPRFTDLYEQARARRQIIFKNHIIEITDEYIILPLGFIKDVTTDPEKILREILNNEKTQ